MFPAMLPVSVIGMPLAGWIFDTVGSYRPAFLVFLACYLLSTIFLLRIRRGAV